MTERLKDALAGASACPHHRVFTLAAGSGMVMGFRGGGMGWRRGSL